MNQLKQIKLTPDRSISIVSVIVAAIALAFAWHANHLAQEANNIAIEANRIADEVKDFTKEANKIAIEENDIVRQQIIADIRAINDYNVAPIFVYGCKYDWSEEFFVLSFAETTVTFTNNGGRPSSLVNIEFVGTDRTWEFTTYLEHEQLNLPVDLEAGVSRKWDFRAKSSVKSASVLEAQEMYEKFYKSRPLTFWLFNFSDGSQVVQTVKTYGSSPGLDFNTHCSDFDNR